MMANLSTNIATIMRRAPSRRGLRDARHNLNQLQVFEGALNRQGRSLPEFRTILEFGCGYGRLTQHLNLLAPQAQIIGCDVSARDIAFCKRHHPRGLFMRHAAVPPLPLADGHCDLIFSYSVFTHLSERNHRAWLAELARVLAPGGLMLHTVHSPACVQRMRLFSPERLPKYALPTEMPAYHYVPYEPSQPEYGLALMTTHYVLTQWPVASGLRIAEYKEGAFEAYPEGCQDLVVLAKEPAH